MQCNVVFEAPCKSKNITIVNRPSVARAANWLIDKLMVWGNIFKMPSFPNCRRCWNFKRNLPSPYLSGVTCHDLRGTFHMSYVICNFFLGQSCETSLRRVCYQRDTSSSLIALGDFSKHIRFLYGMFHLFSNMKQQWIQKKIWLVLMYYSAVFNSKFYLLFWQHLFRAMGTI